MITLKESLLSGRRASIENTKNHIKIDFNRLEQLLTTGDMVIRHHNFDKYYIDIKTKKELENFFQGDLPIQLESLDLPSNPKYDSQYLCCEYITLVIDKEAKEFVFRVISQTPHTVDSNMDIIKEWVETGTDKFHIIPTKKHGVRKSLYVGYMTIKR